MASEEQGRRINDELLRDVLLPGEAKYMSLHTGDPEDTQFVRGAANPFPLHGEERLYTSNRHNLAEEDVAELRQYLSGEIPDLPEGWTYTKIPDEPKTVPLSVYLGDKKFIVGTATVIGRKVHAQIKPEDGRELEYLVQRGLIDGITVRFSTAGPAVPAEPELPFDQVTVGMSKEIKYNFEPTPPYPPFSAKIGFGEGKVPKIKGLTVTHGIVDEITGDKDEVAPFTTQIMNEYWNRARVLEDEGPEPVHDDFLFGNPPPE
jgi:hypothetical protein